MKRKSASTCGKIKGCKKKLFKANTSSVEDNSLKEVTWHKEETMKAKALMSQTGAKHWFKENKMLKGQIMIYEKQLMS